MSEINRRGIHEDGKAILDHIKSLRFHDGDEADFWASLLSDAAILCKSPALFFITRQNNEWRINHEFFGNEALPSDKEFVLSAAITLAERTDQNDFAYERLNLAFPHMAIPVALAVKIDAAGFYSQAVMLLLVDRGDVRQFNDVVIRTQLVSDIPLHYYTRKQSSHVENSDYAKHLLLNVLETTNRVMEKNKFLLSCMTLVNEIAARFNCSQVSIGWKKGDYIRMAATSNLSDFKRYGKAVAALEDLFEEAYEQKEVIVCPETSGGDFKVDRAHRNYMKILGLSQIVTIPIMLDDEVIAVVACEKEHKALSSDETDAIQLILNQNAPWLNMLHDNDRWVGARIFFWFRKMLNSLLGVEHSILKAMAILVTAGFFYSIIGVWDYKVEGNAMLKTDSVSYISAPYDGLISDVYVHEGDEVHRGDHLLKLDTKELVLKEAQESARKISFEREVEKNRAGEEYADMQIAQSRLRETQAELERIRYYLDQADIKAQFEGIVVEGDKRELMGSPVSQGDILLKIARIDAMYATVKISERDIDQIAQGARGQLILLSRPNDTFDIVIDKIVPMAEVDQREGNVFIIKAGIGGKAQAWWRPGMSGIAKINAGEKKIIWIMTHRLTEFIRMYFWW